MGNNDAQTTGDIRVSGKWVVATLGAIIVATGSVLIDIFIFGDADSLAQLKHEVQAIQVQINDIKRDDRECEEHQDEFNAALDELMLDHQELHDKVYEFQPEIRAILRGMDSTIRDCIRRTQ